MPCLARVVDAQTALWHLDGSVASLCGAGDVDKDGYADVAIGGFPAGRVVSGRDAATIYSLPRGTVVRLGDIDRDGLSDLGVLEPNGGQRVVAAYSGKDGKTLLFRVVSAPGKCFSPFPPMRAIGDVDRDGLPDLALREGDRTKPLVETVLVLSGRTGKILLRLTGASVDEYGSDYANAGDLDRDGHDEVAVSLPRADTKGKDAGDVRIYSGRTGAVLRTISAVRGYYRYGAVLGDARDFNTDGWPDLVVGAGTDQVQVVSGKDGKALYTIVGQPGDGFGTSPIVTIDDLDGDRVPDFIAGAETAPFKFTEGKGQARVFSGKDSRHLFTVSKIGEPRVFGALLAAPGDLNRDGRPDFVVGADRYVRAVSGWKLAFHSDQHELLPGTQTLLLDAGARNARKLYLILGSVTGISPGIKLGSYTLPLVPDAYFGLTLVAWNAALGRQFGLLDRYGRTSATFTLPSAFWLPLRGIVFRHAFLVVHAGRFDFTSNAVPTRVATTR